MKCSVVRNSYLQLFPLSVVVCIFWQIYFCEKLLVKSLIKSTKGVRRNLQLRSSKKVIRPLQIKVKSTIQLIRHLYEVLVICDLDIEVFAFPSLGAIQIIRDTFFLGGGGWVFSTVSQNDTWGGRGSVKMSSVISCPFLTNIHNKKF